MKKNIKKSKKQKKENGESVQQIQRKKEFKFSRRLQNLAEFSHVFAAIGCFLEMV